MVSPKKIKFRLFVGFLVNECEIYEIRSQKSRQMSKVKCFIIL